MKQLRLTLYKLPARRTLAAWLVVCLCGLSCLIGCAGALQAAALEKTKPEAANACCRAHSSAHKASAPSLTVTAISGLPVTRQCCMWAGLQAASHKPLRSPNVPACSNSILSTLWQTMSPARISVLPARANPLHNQRRIYLTNRVLLI